jgi:membrane protease YdiL (CAAX protease family)
LSVEHTSTQPAVSRNRWRIHLALIAGYCLLTGLLGGRRQGTYVAALSQTASGLLWVCARELLIFGLLFGLACWASRASRDDLLLRWRGSFQPLLWGAGYSIALRLAISLLIAAIGMALVATGVMSMDSLGHFASANRPRVEAVVNVAALRHNPAYFWLTLTLVSFVVAGLREELWRSAFLAGMQALWPRQCASRAGQILAVVICAVVFGFAHLAMGWLAACMAGLLGVGLGLIMIFHRSIWPAVFAHGIFDATTIALLPWVLARTTGVAS